MPNEDTARGECSFDGEETEIKLEYTLYQPAGYSTPVRVYTSNRCTKAFRYGCDPNNCPIAISHGFQ